MVTQYPHTILSPGAIITEPTLSEGGVWIIPGDVVAPISQQGRAEANTKAYTVPGKDGQQVLYDFMIYLPADALELPYNEDVTIKDDKGKLIGKSIVKRFYRSALHCMVWA